MNEPTKAEIQEDLWSAECFQNEAEGGKNLGVLPTRIVRLAAAYKREYKILLDIEKALTHFQKTI